MTQTEARPVDTPAIEGWAQTPWRRLEQHVYRIQKRIYKAQLAGNDRAVHSLQRLLMKSKAARTIAVRRVTQDNQGKKTAGIDGVKSVSPERRPTLVHLLRTPERITARPTRRVWIPKPGKAEKRPLGIPVMLDRAHQALVKLALEPQWEARFEPNSYGFRPGRSCHDAIEAIYKMIVQKDKYVLDADIQGCFDNINHDALLKKLDAPPRIRRAIKAWLHAGVMDGLDFSPTTSGTPQGGVISPLLANIALHGLERIANTAYTRKDAKGHLTIPMLVRYADDFVVLCTDHEGVEAARTALATWLADMGLHLSPTKTRVSHTRHQIGDSAGFDFLGFTIRQYPVGKYQAGKTSHGGRLGLKTFITPSKQAVTRHIARMGTVIDKNKSAPQEALIRDLNQVSVGWTNYYRSVVAKDVFSTCDHRLFAQLQSWARYRHPRKSRGWANYRYWNMQPGAMWDFVVKKDGQITARLRPHVATAILRHVKVKGTATPYDGNFLYWALRLANHPLTRGDEGKLLKRQKGICGECKLRFRDGDLREIDHIIPRTWGGTDWLSNKQVLHRHCHDQKTARQLAEGRV